jgi:hypothetical protein
MDGPSVDDTACSGPKPGPATTGVPAGVSLTASGSIVVDQPGTVIDGLDVAGEITVRAANVTIRNTRITSGSFYPIEYFDVGLLIEDTEIVGDQAGAGTSGISFENYTARRVNIHGWASVRANADVLIVDSWLHDMTTPLGGADGANVTIRHSVLETRLEPGGGPALQMGVQDRLTVQCSWLDGRNYTVFVGDGSTNTRVVDNRFGRHHDYGPWFIGDEAPILTGNVWDDDGTPIPFP